MMALERRTIADLILHFPAGKKEDDVLVFLDIDGKEEQHFSFERLKQQAVCAAQNIHGLALAGQVAVIVTNDPAAFVPAFFGCILSGVVPIPLPAPRNTQDLSCIDLLRHILKEHRPPVLLVSDEHCDVVSQGIADIDGYPTSVMAISQLAHQSAVFTTLPNIDPDAIAYLQYTSGSTLKPKGVVLRHKQVLDNLAHMYRVFNRAESVRVAGWIPFHHDMGLVGHLFTVLYESGFGVFMPAAAFLAKPSLWLSTIDRYRANSAAAPTFAFEHCCRKIPPGDTFNLSCWKYAYVGSETISVDVLDRFYERFSEAGFCRNSFKPVYGLAEVTLLAAGGGLGLDELSGYITTKNTPVYHQRLLVPYSIEREMQVSIHDPENGLPCDEGQEGEIWLTGSSIGDGYSGDDTGDAFSGQRVKTGDMGFVKGGFVYLTGRCKDIVILRGVNYAAEDLEFVTRFEQEWLRSNDQTVCVSYIDERGESLVVFQEVHRHTTAEQQKEITARIAHNIVQAYGVIPAAVVLTYSGFLPRTRNHKLSRRSCLELYLSGAMKALYVWGSIPGSHDAAEPNDDKIVVIGLACRFPGGANSPEAFWELLANGKDAITEIPAERWDSDLFYDPKPAVPGKMNTRWAGFVDHIDHFDAAHFGISPYEAPEIDPQQRLLLETSWRLLENTGWTKEKLAGSDTGVFVGISTNDYLYMKIKLIPGMESFNAYSGLGNANSVAANRISYFYDLKGPSIAVDTACSSSLTAFHLGVTAILNGECKQAVVGGVNAILSPGPSITLSQFGMMSPEGHCKTFDAQADGYVRAEGCGLVMLKRYSDAVRDGDQVLAIVRASATGQDGQSPGITFPNGAAQRKLLERTLRLSGCNASDISYIEAHGTGTAAGDPVEVEQLAKVYGTAGQTNCCIGSVKANIGHLEAAAGIASVIKAILMLRENKIPPQVHFSELNPKIELKGSRLRIPVELEDWKQDTNRGKKMAISSFGFGGSLAHVILEEPVPAEAREQPALSLQSLFVLSAHSPESLTEQAKTWIDWLEKNTALSIHDTCYSQAVGRTQLKYRQYFLADDTTALLAKLQAFIKVQKASQPAEQVKPAFLFTGQGEYYQDMGKELYHHFPLFAKAFDQCAATVDEQLDGYSLYQLAFGSLDILTMGNRFLQPVSFAVQYALGVLLEECGCIPAVLLGHSLGEYAAACLAGCFEPETGMHMVRKRGELIDGLSTMGKMLTIFCASEEVALQMDSSKASIAAINSANKTVVAGAMEEIDRLADFFNEKEIRVAEIKAPQAFHSLLMDPVLDPFYEYLQQFIFTPPSRKWISSLTGKLMKEAPDASHWVAHLRQQVSFDKAAQVLGLEQAKQYIEIGPGSGTLLAISESLDCSNALLLRTLNFKKGDRTEIYFLLDTIGQLYRSGMNLRAEALLKGGFYPHRIPGQTFKQVSYWMEGLSAAKLSAFAGKPGEQQVLPVSQETKNIHYKIKWVESADHSETIIPETTKESNWVIVGDNSAFTGAIVTALRECKAPVFYIATSSAPNKTLLPDLSISKTPDKKEWRKALDTVVNFKSRVNITSWKLLFICENHFKAAVHQEEEELGSEMNRLLPMVQALQESIPMARLWIVTEESQFVEQVQQIGAHLNLPAAIVWGFGKTLFLEHPEWRGGMIDTDGEAPSAKMIIQKISKPGPGGEACIAIRNGRHYVQKLQPVTTPPVTKAVFRNDGAYIITGGLGGLGLQSASWLVDKGVNHLVLISRRQLTGQQHWPGLSTEHADYETAQSLMALTRKGVKVEVVSADIRDTRVMEELVASLDEKKIPIRGVMHAAGVNWFSKIMQMDPQQLQDTLKIKTEASWTLHRLTTNRDLDCFILFSSVSALWGSVDLSHYTAANHFMDILSWYRYAAGLTTCSINWGPWDDVGMSAGDRERDVLGKLGFSLLSPQEALSAMDGVLSAGWPLSLVTALNWQQFRLFSDFSLSPSLFSEVTNSDVNEKRSQQNGVAIIRSSEPGKARALIEEAVRTELRMVMLIESIDTIHEEQRFNFLGMDSLMAITFVVHLEEYFECKLPSTLVYNYPTIGAVRDYLFDLIYSNGSTPAQGADLPEVTKPVAANSFPTRVILKECAAPDKTTLFCFPYAGSGASAYAKWPLHFNGTMEIIGLQPPGRENRSDEAPYSSIKDIVAEFLENHVDPEGDFYFFGHSLGALIAYEFYVALKKNHRKLPGKIFLCGCGAPLEAFEGKIHQLDGDAFINAIAQSYGEAEWPAERKSAAQYHYELLKSDIQALENYQSKRDPIEVPVVAICGLQDCLAPPQEVEKWSQLTKAVFSLKQIDGAHDLVRNHTAELTQIIRSMLHTPTVVS